MNKTMCIFKSSRCKKCDNLILKSEDHTCKKKPALKLPYCRRLDLEILEAFNELGPSLTSSEINHYINKQNGNLGQTHFMIEFHMKRKPDKFAVDLTKKYRNKYSDRYYFRINRCKDLKA